MEIPKNALCKYKGIIFQIYEYPQRLYDGTIAPFEKIVRRPTVDIIAVVGDKIIILEQEQPGKEKYLCLPGGAIDDGENAKEAALRELLEETGYSSDAIQLIHEEKGGAKFYFHQYVFVAKNCKKIGEQKLDGGEKIRVDFTDFEGFLALCRNRRFSVTREFILEMYEALLDNKKKDKLQKKIFG